MMSRAIHLCIGGNDGNVLSALVSGGLPMQEMCILRGCDPDGTVGLAEGLKSIGFRRIRIIVTDLGDYNRVFDSVCSVCSGYDDARFYVNIGMGDPVSVSAMTSAAQSFDSLLYYVKDDRAVTIQSDSLPEMAELKSKRKVLETFLRFRGKPRITNRDLMGSLSNSALTYHTRMLSDMGLISKEGSAKTPIWVLTNKGEQMLRRI